MGFALRLVMASRNRICVCCRRMATGGGRVSLLKGLDSLAKLSTTSVWFLKSLWLAFREWWLLVTSGCALRSLVNEWSFKFNKRAGLCRTRAGHTCSAGSMTPAPR